MNDNTEKIKPIATPIRDNAWMMMARIRTVSILFWAMFDVHLHPLITFKFFFSFFFNDIQKE